jgi:ADP-ribose pyrophosphatase YjhB (NUDIX family)
LFDTPPKNKWRKNCPNLISFVARVMMRQQGRLSQRQWARVVLTMPIPCVDVIVEKESKVLMGFRVVDPYRNVWALPGGRILKHGYPEDAVRRNLDEIGVAARIRNLVGVFPVMFSRHALRRYDITLCYRTEWIAGEPKPGSQLLRFRWVSPRRLPANTGANYRKMIRKAFSGSLARRL